MVRLLQRWHEADRTGEPMTTSRAGELLRKPGDPQRATFLELFFDLAFVFALTQLSHGLIQDLTWSGAFQTLVLLLAVWWVWFSTAWITDRFDPQRPAIQLLVIATMVGSLVMAAALPEAFGRQGLVFAGAYVAIQIGRSIFLVLALRGHELRRTSVRQLFWFGVSAVPWIAGALAHGTARGALWTLAVAVDYTAYADSASPRRGSAARPRRSSPIAAEHLAERYRQFFIIALGELILVTGLAFSGSGFAADRSAAFVVSIATTVLLWRIYIYRAGELLAAAIAAARRPGPPCRIDVLRPPGHGGRHRRHRRRRRTRHRPPARTHATGLDRRHPRRTRAVPGRARPLRVRGLRPRVPRPADRAARAGRPDTGDAPPAAAAGRHSPPPQSWPGSPSPTRPAPEDAHPNRRRHQEHHRDRSRAAIPGPIHTESRPAAGCPPARLCRGPG